MIIFDRLIDPDKVTIPDALLIALIAMGIVFLVLCIVIGTTFAFQKGTDVVLSKTQIQPRKENAIVETDKDALVALLVATIDFHKPEGKDARVVSIKRIED